MLLLVVTLLIGAVVLGLLRTSVRNGRKDVNLGSMSDQWLAEYRAMHSS